LAGYGIATKPMMTQHRRNKTTTCIRLWRIRGKGHGFPDERSNTGFVWNAWTFFTDVVLCFTRFVSWFANHGTLQISMLQQSQAKNSTHDFPTDAFLIETPAHPVSGTYIRSVARNFLIGGFALVQGVLAFW